MFRQLSNFDSAPAGVAPKTTMHGLGLACKRTRQRIQAALNRIDLHIGQDLILAVLWDREGRSLSEICEILCIQAPTLTRSLAYLEKIGLVYVQPDPEDGRVSRVFLTGAGQKIRADVCAIWEELDRSIFFGLSQADRDELDRLLMQVNSNLGVGSS